MVVIQDSNNSQGLVEEQNLKNWLNRTYSEMQLLRQDKGELRS